ncbi:MAG TPA: hypothetical protein ENJ53_02325 [Phaeodactylibacter sp.]|nr:hypothetical protein [Phaeodactylibacter sp.]
MERLKYTMPFPIVPYPKKKDAIHFVIFRCLPAVKNGYFLGRLEAILLLSTWRVVVFNGGQTTKNDKMNGIQKKSLSTNWLKRIFLFGKIKIPII